MKTTWPGAVETRPDFRNLLEVVARRVPDRPTLIELFLNPELQRLVIEPERTMKIEKSAMDTETLTRIWAFRNLGYDHATVKASEFTFPARRVRKTHTVSLNEGAVITDRAGFESYPWPDPGDFSCERLGQAERELPDGMKLIAIGPRGVLENVVQLAGYDTLCFMLHDDPDLAEEIFAAVGSRLVDYYREVLQYDSVGAIWANDDWGFKTQTMISPEHMRRYVVPWHAEIARAAHEAGKPSLLHSCGEIREVLDDVVEVIGHDARHSYEDAIQPVEEAYEEYGSRIAILGGIDMDFLCRSEPEAVYRRARAMLERTAERGGYALGTGNSVPEYIPLACYFAMLSAVWEARSLRIA